MFELAYPWALALIILFIFGSIKLKPKEDALLLSGLWGDGVNAKSYLFIFKWLGILFLIFALASPISKEEFLPNKRPANAIMMCLDLSGSMKYGMNGGSKIEVAKRLASKFVQKRKDDHVGLVGFADFAYMATPLSYDTKAVGDVISRLGLGNGTALRDSIFMALRMLKKSQAKEKIIVLLTDGMDNASQMPIQTLLKMIKKEGVKIYTIGVGRRGDFDSRMLAYISKISGGKFYHANSAGALKSVYEQINKLEKSELEEEKIEQVYYYYQYPLFFALLFFILYLYFKVRRGN